MEFLDKQRLSIELLKSIRDIDVRISELKLMLVNHSSERRNWVVQRVDDLIHTRFLLIHSFMDVNPNTNKVDKGTNPFDFIDTGYTQLKRKL
jgi:hypothetical protein